MTGPSPAKKPKVEEKKKSAFSSLLKKVSDSTPEKGAASDATVKGATSTLKSPGDTPST
jgi:hypothetical protein